MLKNILKNLIDAAVATPSWKEEPKCVDSHNNVAACESRTSGFNDLKEFKEKFQIALPIGGDRKSVV